MTEDKLSSWLNMLGFYDSASRFFVQKDLAQAAPLFLRQISQISGVGDCLLLQCDGPDALTVFTGDTVCTVPTADLLDDLSLLFALSGCTRIESHRHLPVLQALQYPDPARVSDIVHFSFEFGANRRLFFMLLKLGVKEAFDDNDLKSFDVLAEFLEQISTLSVISRDGEMLSQQLRQQHRREGIWLESLAWLNEMGATSVQVNVQADFYKAALFQIKLLVSADMVMAIQFNAQDETLSVNEVHGESQGVESLLADLASARVAQSFEAHMQVKWNAEQHVSVAAVGLKEVLVFVFAQQNGNKTLFLIGKAGSVYDAHEETVARLFADGVSHIIEREHLLDEIRRKNNELEHDQAEQAKLIKQLSEAQDQLLQQEKMASIGQLAAGVAHEINNPVGYVNSNINSLEGYINDLFDLLEQYSRLEKGSGADSTVVAEIARLKKAMDFDFIQDDVHDLVRESKEGVLRVKQIVKDLKDFSHVDEAEWQMADLVHGMNSTLNIVHNELKYKATIEKDYDVLPPVECVPSQINQVVMNLLVNAGHAIEERGSITMRAKKLDDKHVYIEVEDSGKGIPEENLVKIFNPFFTTKPVGKGTGLGLSLSYSIIEKHKGNISVRSTVGVGTCFRITLPIQQEERKADA